MTFNVAGRPGCRCGGRESYASSWMSTRCGSAFVERVDHEVRGPLEVLPERCVVLRRKVERIHGASHVGEPGVPFDRADPKRGVTHAQPRSPALCRARGRAT